MKQRMQGFIIGFLIAVMVFGTVTVVAAPLRRTIEVMYGVSVVLDGVQQSFPDDMRPFVSEGRTFMPLRAIADTLGLEVEWDGSTSTAYLTSRDAPPVIQPGQGRLIYEDENIRVTFAGTRIGGTSTRPREEIQFFVENRTIARLVFQADSMSINGISLGRVSGSESVAPNSSGIIRFSTAEAFPTMNPSTISGSMVAIDWDRILIPDGQISRTIAEITFTNVNVD